MTREQKIALKAACIRFMRVVVPQIPAIIAQVGTVTQYLTLPAWVIPALTLFGAFLTALDKFLRQMGAYE